MLGGTYLLTKLLLPALEKAASTAEAPPTESTAAAGGGSVGVEGAGARVINVSSGGMYTVSGAGIADDIDSEGVEPYDGTIV